MAPGKFRVQHNQEGFGHAVYAAREVIGDEPFLLMLGDHIYRADIDVSCARQLLESHQAHGVSVLGLRRTPEQQTQNYGVVAGVWIEEDCLLNVTEFVEKPTIDYARTDFYTPGLPDGEYLTIWQNISQIMSVRLVNSS